MKDLDRNKIIRILVEGITRNLESNNDVDVTLNRIDLNEDLVTTFTLDLNGTFLPLPLLKELSLVIGDENLWVCSWGDDGLKVVGQYKKSICNNEE